MNSITIKWLGHACFKLSANGGSVILDPYEDGSVPGLSPLTETAGKVLKSHDHGDHGALSVIAIHETEAKDTLLIETIDSYHDPVKGLLRGKNKITVLRANGMKVVHFGDIGCKLTAAQTELVRNADLIMIPVGGHFTIDAKEAAELCSVITPRVVIPMHYRSESFGYPVIGVLSDFTDLRTDVITYDTDTLTLTPDTPPQTAVLTYQKS